MLRCFVLGNMLPCSPHGHPRGLFDRLFLRSPRTRLVSLAQGPLHTVPHCVCSNTGVRATIICPSTPHLAFSRLKDSVKMRVPFSKSGKWQTHRIHSLCKTSAQVATGALGSHADTGDGPGGVWFIMVRSVVCLISACAQSERRTDGTRRSYLRTIRAMAKGQPKRSVPSKPSWSPSSQPARNTRFVRGATSKPLL